MVRATTYDHDGVLYDVRDFQYKGTNRVWVELNSRDAEGRLFLPREPGHTARVYHFRSINYGTSDPETLAQQFKFSHPTQGR